MSDDLFRPSVQRTLRSPARGRPWDKDYSVLVGLFGGVWALAAITLLNMHRLGMDARAQLARVLGSALVTWLVVSAVGITVIVMWGPDRFVVSRVRLAYRGAAMLLALLHLRWQLPGERRYELAHGDENYASLWIPGIAAVVGGTLLQDLGFGTVAMPLACALTDMP
ncbi:MAG: hypothetical protein AAF602_01440 [Myxococcota bacterium]